MKDLLSILAVGAVLFLLAGCATPPAGDFCDVSRPWRLSDATIDAMTADEAAEALSHNIYGQSACGWRP